MSELTTKFESLETGDEIVVPQYANPLTVVEVLESVGIVELEGQRGGEKSLVQNKNNEEQISLMAGADKKGMVTEFEIVHKENAEDEDDTGGIEVGPDVPEPSRKTGADLFDSVLRVLAHDTMSRNETVRITLEHPDYAGGVSSWLRYSKESAAQSVQKHVSDMQVARVEVVDEAGLGICEQSLLEGGKPQTAGETGVSA